MDKRQGWNGPTFREVVSAAFHDLHEGSGSAERFSFACFDDEARILDTCVPGSDWERVESAMAGYGRYRGTTNFALALTLAVRWNESHATGERAVIFLTDGRNTRGSLSVALDAAQTLAESGVTLHAFGLGPGVCPETLERLAAPSGGGAHCLEDGAQLALHFELAIRATRPPAD